MSVSWLLPCLILAPIAGVQVELTSISWMAYRYSTCLPGLRKNCLVCDTHWWCFYSDLVHLLIGKKPRERDKERKSRICTQWPQCKLLNHVLLNVNCFAAVVVYSFMFPRNPVYLGLCLYRLLSSAVITVLNIRLCFGSTNSTSLISQLVHNVGFSKMCTSLDILIILFLSQIRYTMSLLHS